MNEIGPELDLPLASLATVWEAQILLKRNTHLPRTIHFFRNETAKCETAKCAPGRERSDARIRPKTVCSWLS